MWDIEFTDEFGIRWDTLSEKEQDAIEATVNVLQTEGPDLGRSWADRIQHSSLQNLKELRPPSTHIRVLFVFDPRRCAILLIGGNKERQWRTWYKRMIPVAERLYAEHLQQLKDEGLL